MGFIDGMYILVFMGNNDQSTYLCNLKFKKSHRQPLHMRGGEKHRAASECQRFRPLGHQGRPEQRFSCHFSENENEPN